MSFRYPFAVVRPGYDPLRNPNAPTIGTATAGNQSASVTFTAPSNTGGGAITSYTVVSSGGQYNTGASSPITVSGLTNGTSYTFVVFATNAYGPGPNSAASNSVTPALQLQLWAWGQNTYGQLGQGNTTNYSSPKQVGALTDWYTPSSSGLGNASFVIKKDGTLWSWGLNGNGQLGQNNTTYYSSPKQIGALTTWSKISSGVYNGYAIKTDGTLWVWGFGGYGTLGLGNLTDYSSPKQVGALTNWALVSGSNNCTAAIKTDGTLWTWGQGSSGQLGLGNTTNYSSPKQVGSDTNWQSVSGSIGSMFALKTNGTIWGWGNNGQGQLGLGNSTNYSSPMQIGSGTNWVSIVGNSRYGCFAIKNDGTLWSWGYGFYGELGLGNLTVYSSPMQVGALTNWSKVSACQFESTIALKTDGTLWSWGYNGSGQLGLGNTTNYSSPKQIGSLTTWTNIGPQYGAVLAIKTP